MTEPGWVRHGLRIAFVEYRRTVRAVRQDAARMLLVGFLAVMFGGMLLAFGYLFMDELQAIEGTVELPDAARSMLTYFWAFAVYAGAARTLQQQSRIEGESLVLTTVSARSAAMGLVLSELLRALTYLVLFVSIVTGIAVYAFGSAASLVAVPVGVTLFVLSGLVVGQAIGFGAALLVTRVPTVVKYKTQITVATVVVLVLGVVTLQSRMEAGTLGSIPVGWFADLLVVGTPVQGSTSRAAGAIGLVLVEFAVVGLVLDRLVRELWYADPVQLEGEGVERTGADGDDALAAATWLPMDDLEGVLPWPAMGVARRLVVRLQRNPGRLSFLLVPVIFAGEGLYFAYDADMLEPVLMPFFAVFVPWLAGATFGMNPLGDDGNVLPFTLTSGLSGRQHLLGLVTPGLVLGVPLLVAGVVGGGVYGGYDQLEVAATFGAGVVLLAASVVVAPAIGMQFPRFTAISIGRSRDVIPPSITSAVLYTLLTAAVGGLGVAFYLAPEATLGALGAVFGLVLPAVLRLLADQGAGFLTGPASFLEDIGDGISSADPGTAQVVGFALPMALLVAFVLVGGWSVVRKFDGYVPG